MLLLAFATTAATLHAATPVVFWDGAASGYKFDNLTRTAGGNTYTLNLNPVGSANTVSADSSYIQIANDNAQCGITITTQDAGGFGSSGTLSVIMKCRDMPVAETSNRAIISLMDGNKYKYGGTSQPDNGAVLGMYINAGTSGWIWKGSTAGMAGLSGDFLETKSGAFSADEQVVALTYSGANGTCYYVNGSLIQSQAGLKATELASPVGVALGGVDVSTGSQFYALKNMKIEAVAIFTSTLTAEEVASYTFPSEAPVNVTSDTTVSAINGMSSAKDLYLRVSDGVTITGDTTFSNATTVHFICEGSFTITPPAGNTAAFDFRVSGSPRVMYTNSIPTKSGNVFTDTTVPTNVTSASDWKGTIWLKNIQGVTGDNFLPNNFGNALSTLRLTGVSGWLWSATANNTINPAIELDDDGGAYALCLSNGYSYGGGGDYHTIFSELKGSGTLIGNGSAPYVALNFRKWDNFTGTLSLANKIAVFGSTMPSTSDINRAGGEIWLMGDADVTIASGKTWYVPNGVKVKGSCSYATLSSNLSRIESNTNVVMLSGSSITGANTIDSAGLSAVLSKVSGDITFAYSGSLPPANVFTSDAWKGTVKISNIGTATNFDPGKYGNAGSTIEVSGIGTTAAHFGKNSIFLGRLVLKDNGGVRALALNNGYTDDCITIGELAGDGTFSKNDGDDISQGITINVMTNFTGTLALTNMTVTFGTTNRAGRAEGHSKDNEYKRMLFIDPDAVVSVPAGFELWNPEEGIVPEGMYSIIFNGTVNFTTDEADFEKLTLFKNVGTGQRKIYFGQNAVIKVNGEEYDRSVYIRKIIGSDLVLKKKKDSFTIICR